MSTDAQIPTTGPTGPVTETIGPATTNADVTDTPLPTDVKEDSALGPAEGAPSDKANAEAVPNVTNAPKEEKIAKGEVKVESHPINEGVLNLKSPGIKYEHLHASSHVLILSQGYHSIEKILLVQRCPARGTKPHCIHQQ